MGRPGDETALSPERVAELVRSLASVMRQADVNELDLDLGPLTLRLRRPVRDMATSAPVTEAFEIEAAADLAAQDHVITAPMIGTFYRSPTPGAPAFVTEGDLVTAGQTIGVIEAMKIMNEIAADRSGIVSAVLAGNGEPVEYGSPLMLLDLKAGAQL